MGGFCCVLWYVDAVRGMSLTAFTERYRNVMPLRSAKYGSDKLRNKSSSLVTSICRTNIFSFCTFILLNLFTHIYSTHTDMVKMKVSQKLHKALFMYFTITNTLFTKWWPISTIGRSPKQICNSANITLSRIQVAHTVCYLSYIVEILHLYS